MYIWLCWVLFLCGALVAASRGYFLVARSSHCGDLSLLQSTGSIQSTQAQEAVVHRLTHPMACGTSPNQGSNPHLCVSRQILQLLSSPGNLSFSKLKYMSLSYDVLTSFSFSKLYSLIIVDSAPRTFSFLPFSNLSDQNPVKIK